MSAWLFENSVSQSSGSAPLEIEEALSDTTFNGQKVTSFSMEYDKSKKHSRWIAFRFDSQTKQQNVSRSDEPFDADPAIGSQYQRVQADFGKQGYDGGHLCVPISC